MYFNISECFYLMSLSLLLYPFALSSAKFSFTPLSISSFSKLLYILFIIIIFLSASSTFLHRYKVFLLFPKTISRLSIRLTPRSLSFIFLSKYIPSSSAVFFHALVMTFVRRNYNSVQIKYNCPLYFHICTSALSLLILYSLPFAANKNPSPLQVKIPFLSDLHIFR